MVADRGLLDTSVVVSLGEHLGHRDFPSRLFISSVTLAELSVGPLVAQTDDERADRLSVLQQVEAHFDPLPFDGSAARAFGRVAADLRGSGRKTSARAFDALIAATALAHDLPIVTANAADFTGIRGLNVIDLLAD